MFITFEEMKSDLSAVIDKVSTFLGKSISSTDKPKLVDHLSFDSMKKNAAVNKEDFVKVNLRQFSRLCTVARTGGPHNSRTFYLRIRLSTLAKLL